MDKDRISLQLNKIFVLAFFAIACLIMFVMSTDVISAIAHADYTPKVTVENKTVHRGQTFTIDVDLTNNEGLIALYLTLDYESSVMKLVNVEQGNALSSLTFTNTNTQTVLGYGILPFNMLWDGRKSDNFGSINIHNNGGSAFCLKFFFCLNQFIAYNILHAQINS